MPIPLPDLPVDNTGICIVIPNSPEWRQIYLGALVILQQWWYWDVQQLESAEDVVQRVMQCAYLTGIDGFDDCMDICAQVLDCILNDTDVRNAINDIYFAQTLSILRDNSQLQSNLVLGSGNNPTCDLDALFGGVVSVIDRAEQNNQDALEQFEVATNIQEIASLIFPNTLEDGTSFVNAMLDWIQWMQDNIIENYLAEVTTAYLEELYCDLFCMAKDDCVLTPQMLVDYFSSRLSSAITFSSLFNETVTFLITGSWSGTEIADVFFLSQFAIRAQVGGFLSYLGFSDVDRDMRLGFLQPNTTWTILCTDCDDTWEHVFDFSVADGGFVPQTGGNSSNVFGTWNSAVWTTQDKQWDSSPAHYRRALVLQRDFTETYISEIDYLWDFSEGTTPSTVTMLAFLARLSTTQVGENLVYTNLTIPSASNQMHTLSIEGNCDNIRAYLGSSNANSAVYSGSASLKSITVRGTGTNPFL